MPEKPPTTGRIRERSVVGVAAEEVTIVSAVGSAKGRSKAGLWQVDLDEVPSGTKSASRTIGDEEETIWGESNRGVKRSAISR